MKILICIDDTDNLESRGTGELAEFIAEGIEQRGWGICSVITRHQLLIHDDIPYTSHNSSMCFQVECNPETHLEEIITFASGFLELESADGSDPGLAVVEISMLSQPDAVIEFGQLAKREVLTKDSAYDFAKVHGIHLSEHGGTGQGIIGALAGIGLRMSGSDGRIKGKLKLADAGMSLSVHELLAYPQIDSVQDIDGASMSAEEAICMGEKVKTVWLNHQMVLLVSRSENGWKTCGRQQLRDY